MQIIPSLLQNSGREYNINNRIKSRSLNIKWKYGTGKSSHACPLSFVVQSTTHSLLFIFFCLHSYLQHEKKESAFYELLLGTDMLCSKIMEEAAPSSNRMKSSQRQYRRVCGEKRFWEASSQEEGKAAGWGHQYAVCEEISHCGGRLIWSTQTLSIGLLR